MIDKAEAFAKIIYELARNKDDEEKERVITRLVAFLRKKREVYLLPRILECYERYLNRKKGVLIFARAMDDATANNIKSIFGNILRETDTTEIKIDKNIIGGFIIKTENFLVNASVKSFLDKIRNKFSI